MSTPRLCLMCLISLVAVSSAPAQAQVLREGGTARWMRGNMHTHSLWSDGDDYPEMIGLWYRDHGYQFVVYTDHNTLHDTERWIPVEGNKGGQKAFDRLLQTFGPDWAETRIAEEKLQVRLKTFDQTFTKLAVPHEFLPIQGEEITDSFKGAPVHLCVSHTGELLPPAHGDSIVEVMQNNIDLAVSRRRQSAQRLLVHLNHPNFHYAVTAEQLMRVVGENFFEVYNGHPSVQNSGDAQHASTEKMWDIINTWRITELNLPLMMGLATDDAHAWHETIPGQASQPGRGWVMVLSDELDPDVLVDALEGGRFYASSGVLLEEIAVSGDSLSVKVIPQQETQYRIEFIGTRRDFDSTSHPAVEDPEKADSMTRIYSDDVGKVLMSVDGDRATYTFQGDELYVRARITSSRLHPNPSETGDYEQAWVQPVRPGADVSGR